MICCYRPRSLGQLGAACSRGRPDHTCAVRVLLARLSESLRLLEDGVGAVPLLGLDCALPNRLRPRPRRFKVRNGAVAVVHDVLGTLAPRLYETLPLANHTVAATARDPKIQITRILIFSVARVCKGSSGLVA